MHHPSPADPYDPLTYFKTCLERSRTDLGRTTVAVLGRTGAGKSTLVNGVFGDAVAAAGVGAPVTQRLVEHRAPGAPLTLLDNPGFELGGDLDRAADEIAALVEERARRGVGEALHVVWYCIDVEQARLEPAEETLLRRCAAAVPTLVVLTQSWGPSDEATVALSRHVEGLGLPVEAILAVLAERRVISGHAVESFGLRELVAATVGVLPDAARRAFVVTQRLAMESKVVEARAIVARRAFEAAGLAAPAGPGRVGHENLARHQLRMLAEISSVFASEVPEMQLTVLVEVVLRGAQSTRDVATRLLTLLGEAGVPLADVGSAVVGAGAAVAATRVLGEAYVKLMTQIAARELRGESIGDHQLVELFKIILRGGLDS